jgi:hypothetical protein
MDYTINVVPGPWTLGKVAFKPVEHHIKCGLRKTVVRANLLDPDLRSITVKGS